MIKELSYPEFVERMKYGEYLGSSQFNDNSPYLSFGKTADNTYIIQKTRWRKTRYFEINNIDDLLDLFCSGKLA